MKTYDIASTNLNEILTTPNVYPGAKPKKGAKHSLDKNQKPLGSLMGKLPQQASTQNRLDPKRIDVFIDASEEKRTFILWLISCVIFVLTMKRRLSHAHGIAPFGLIMPLLCFFH
ncbi:hypothetical protein AVEN_269569-1 [Araneus ventricosus]|uniref:Uncharacterized protein n=1 Tax=Araneus ventricosus TaxID=182803 RepID=A0A4Y2CF63_ARAVE|nr:hypothetical protein AVEN_269569-1 [Araneus ventricosus]